MRVPELYAANLAALSKVLQALEELSKIDGLFSVEIRVKVEDVDSWAVVGWAESGDPAVLRFEDDSNTTLIRTPGPLRSKPMDCADPKLSTFEPKTPRRCRCGDFAQSSGSCGPNGCYNVPA